MKHQLLFLLLFSISSTTIFAQYERRVATRDFQSYYRAANYDESLVPDYQLPDPLLCLDGTHVTDMQQWEQHRRPELIRLLTEYMYGHAPAPDSTFSWEVVSTQHNYLGKRATRRNVILHLTAHGPDVPLCIVVPDSNAPCPLFVGPSFDANDSIWTPSTRAWATWSPDSLLNHGYGLVTFRYTDACPDRASDHFRSSALHHHFYRPGQQYPLPNEWGAIGAWSWTLSRVMDYLEHEPLVDAQRAALIGHSRLGKTVLWAGALDHRFRIVIPVNSGCCGAAISRRCVGETVECVNEFSHQWFCGNFRQFSHREEEMPFDQHEVLALIAPRPLYIASAQEDQWADPRGEFLSAQAAQPVYALYGLPGIVGSNYEADGTTQCPMPDIDQPAAQGTIAYHIRSGPHAVLPFDWAQFIAFANRYLK